MGDNVNLNIDYDNGGDNDGGDNDGNDADDNDDGDGVDVVRYPTRFF